jgi:hypothetical protein
MEDCSRGIQRKALNCPGIERDRRHHSIYSRLTARAEFEIGSGISINPSLPETDAESLNKEE